VPRDQGKTRTQLLRDRHRQLTDMNVARMQSHEERVTNTQHRDFSQSWNTAHPWKTAVTGNTWARREECDKEEQKHRPFTTPVFSGALRSLTSEQYGQHGTSGPDLQEWNVRQKRHKFPIAKKREDVLSKASYKPAPPSFSDTYGNIMGNGACSAKDVFGDRTIVLKHRPVTSMEGSDYKETWATYGNPRGDGQVLSDHTKRTTPGGGGSATMDRPAGILSGQFTDVRGRQVVERSHVLSVGNELVSPVIQQSKFAYNKFQLAS
jgi:hypothetical protein